MKLKLGIRTGILSLLLFELLATIFAYTLLMNATRKEYTELIYENAGMLVSQYASRFTEGLEDFYALADSFRSNDGIRKDMRLYENAPGTPPATAALGDLHNIMYQLTFSAPFVEFMTFEFNDGKSVIAGISKYRSVIDQNRREIITLAHEANGRFGWYLPEDSGHAAILYQLVRDPSEYGMPARGVLMMYIDFDLLIRNLTDENGKILPELICFKEDKLLSRTDSMAAAADLRTSLHKAVENTTGRSKIYLGDTAYFLSAQKLGREDFTLLYLQSEDEVLGNFYKVNRKYVLGVVLLGMVLLILGTAAAWAMTKPLRRLTKDMEHAIQEKDTLHPLHLKAPEVLKLRFHFQEIKMLADSYTQLIERIDNLIHEVYAKELVNAQIKYKTLQENIRPHFLYNTLDTINWKAILSGNMEVSAMVRSLSNLLRISLSGSDMITLREELGFLDEYLTIQKMRFEDRLDFQKEVDFQVLDCKIPRLTLQPLIENCICHNLEKHSGVCHIALSAALIKDGSLISVSDDGNEVNIEEISRHLSEQKAEGTAAGGIGLYNINQRLLIAFGEACGLQLEPSESGGMKVSFLLPLEND